MEQFDILVIGGGPGGYSLAINAAKHGKKVARGVYFGLVDFKAQNGREHCQKVVKILIP